MRGNFDWNGKYMVINMNSRWKRQILKQNSQNPLKNSENSRFRQIHLVYLPKIGRIKKPGLHIKYSWFENMVVAFSAIDWRNVFLIFTAGCWICTHLNCQTFGMCNNSCYMFRFLFTYVTHCQEIAIICNFLARISYGSGSGLTTKIILKGVDYVAGQHSSDKWILKFSSIVLFNVHQIFINLNFFCFSLRVSKYFRYQRS